MIRLLFSDLKSYKNPTDGDTITNIITNILKIPKTPVPTP